MNLQDMITKNSQLLARCNELAGLDDISAEQKAEFDAKLNEARALDNEIAKRQELEDLTKSYAEGDKQPRVRQPKEVDETLGFKSLGEQLQAVRHSSGAGARLDPRLDSKASGMNVSAPSEGGFLVAPSFANDLLRRTYETGAILSRVSRLPLSGSSNSIKVNYVDETSRANGSRWGGITTYWVPEAGAITASKPAIGQSTLSLHKIAAALYATEEMLEDAAFLGGLVNEAFPNEMSFAIEDSLVNGTGAGQPQGVLVAPCKIEVPKETNQAADTIVFANILKMWSRMWGRARSQAVWLISQDVEPQLYQMTMPVGTGGVPVYLPPSGAAGNPYATLMGRPVIPVEYCDKLGDAGDIILGAWNEYAIIDKGGLKGASSLHVKFLEDEQVFKWTYRIDGQPKWHSALTPKNGGSTQSVFLTLAARA